MNRAETQPLSHLLKPRHAARRVERIAAETLERCRLALGLDAIPLPVPVEQWIEHPLGIGFGVADLSDRGPNVLGATNVVDREILVSETLTHEGRFRFTCAHELGHVVLHSRLAETFVDSEVMAARMADKIEWQADRFAAAFLIPIPSLILELFAIAEAKGLEAQRCVAELMRGTPEAAWLWKKCFLPRLTDTFEVSLSAMVNRLSDIRLPDEGPFLLPRHLPMLYAAAERPADPEFTVVNGFPCRPPTLFPPP
jgi:hypothetical protein